MRIIIETGGAEGVSVTQETAGATAALVGASSTDLPEAIDGGGPPEDLMELLSGELEGETEEVEPEDAEEKIGRAPDDGGGVPAWLVEVIEGSEGGLSEEAYSETPEDE